MYYEELQNSTSSNITANRSRFKEKLVTSIPDLTVSGMGVTL